MTMLCCGVITPQGSLIRHSENGRAVQTLTNAETGQVVKTYSPARPRLLERMIRAALWFVVAGFLWTICYHAGRTIGASIITQ